MSFTIINGEIRINSEARLRDEGEVSTKPGRNFIPGCQTKHLLEVNNLTEKIQIDYRFAMFWSGKEWEGKYFKCDEDKISCFTM